MDPNYNSKLDGFIEKLKKCEYIENEKDVKTLCDKAKDLLIKQANVIYLNSPITVSKKNLYLY